MAYTPTHPLYVEEAQIDIAEVTLVDPIPNHVDMLIHITADIWDVIGVGNDIIIIMRHRDTFDNIGIDL